MIKIDPSSTVVTQGQCAAFHASDQNGQPVAAQWTVAPAGAGTINAAGTYRSPAAIAAPATATVQAVAGADAATACIALVPPELSILPGRAALRAGESQTLAAVMPGAANPVITWAVSPDAPAWDALTHKFSAPAKVTEKRTYTITARTVDPPGSATVAIDLVPAKPSGWLTLALGLYLVAAYALTFAVIDLWPPAPGSSADLTKLQSERDTLQTNVESARAAAAAAAAPQQAPGGGNPAETAMTPAVPDTGKGTATDSRKPPAVADVKKTQAGKDTSDKNAPAGKGPQSTAPAEATRRLKDAESALASKNDQIGAALGAAAKTPFPTKYFGKVDRDKDLIWIALLSGALGAFLYGAKSFVSYLGNETFQSSWTGWYLFTPLIGSSLALVFYMVFRGGLLTSASSVDVNPYGIAGLSALVGMFTKQATNKLEEVFSTMFRSNKDQDLKDKLPSGAPQPK
jgi:hypothetical protein